MTEIIDSTPTTDEERREALRERIEASEARNQERTLAEQARSALDSATEFVKERPLTAVAGAAAIALAIGAMTRPGRRLGRRGGVLAASATEAALAYALGLIERAETTGSAALRSGADTFGDLSNSLGSTARKLRRETALGADSASDALRSSARKVSGKTSRGLRDLRSRFTH